jgi:hypothetical protein
MGTEETTKQVHPTIPISKKSDKAEILVRNFVSQYRRPFSVDTISSYTGISTKHLKPIIDRLISDQEIKVVSVDPEQIYVKANRYMGIYETTHDHNRWNFDPERAMILINEIFRAKHTGIRSIAKNIGKSRQWVYVYLEALASIGVIGRVDGFYEVTSLDKLLTLGVNLNKGILRTMYKNTNISI